MRNATSHVHLLGAGFTRGVVEDAPLTDELMGEIDIGVFPEIHDDYKRAFPNIEQFLSLLDLRLIHFAQADKSLADRLGNIRDDIARQIVGRVDVARLQVDRLDRFPLLRRFIETIPSGACVLTLNYDCVLDQGLYHSGRWSPHGGYAYSGFPHVGNDNESKDRILLLKLHGSCNFREPEQPPKYFNIEVTDRLFPGISSHINPNGMPHVLLMSYLKRYHNGIMSLWKEAISSLEKADKLTIVGCSLRDEDTFLRYALYHFGMRQDCKEFLLEIVDKGEDNCAKIEEKVRGLVARPSDQHITRFPGGLADWLDGS